MATYKGDIRYRFKCTKCKEPIGEAAHEYCRKKGLPDLCFEHQPNFIKKVLGQFKKGGE